MNFKKCISLLMVFILSFSFFAAKGAIAAGEAKISIDVTKKDGSPVSVIKVDDIIKVTVKMSDFNMLSAACPALHFNPEVVKVTDVSGTAAPDFIRGAAAMAYFEKGDATTPGKWGGSFEPTTKLPLINNETGLISLYVDGYPVKDLEGEQSIYSVYMKAVKPGSADIRLSRHTDGDGKANPEDYYASVVYPDDYLGDFTPQYFLPSQPHSLPAEAEYNVLTNQPLVYTKISVKGTDGTYSYADEALIGDTIRLDIHVLNINKIANICLPLKYDKEAAEMLDRSGKPVTTGILVESVLDVTSKLELFANEDKNNPGGGGYPQFDTEKGFLRLLFLSENINMPTSMSDGDLICSVYFKAIKHTDEFIHYFTSNDSSGDPYDPNSEHGVMYKSDILIGWDAPPEYFPETMYARLKIPVEKSKKPDLVAVIPNPDGETATVIVTGVTPGAEVIIYGEGGNPIGVPAIADENGSAIFVDVPLDETISDHIYANAKEPDKDRSDKEWGEPDNPQVEKVLISLEPLELIIVNYGTPEEEIVLPTYVNAILGYKLPGYNDIFVSGEFTPLPLPADTWTGTYNGNVSDLYNLYNTPSYPAGIISDKQAKQPIFVRPEGVTASQHIVIFISEEVMYGQSQKVNDGAKATEPAIDPVKEGFAFEGWYIQDDAGDLAEYDFDTPVTKDIVLHAVFTEDTTEKKYTVSGALSGGNVSGLTVSYKLDNSAVKTVTTDSSGNYIITEVPHGVTIVITPPAQTGYTVSPLSRSREVKSNITDQDFFYTLNTVGGGGGGGGGGGYSTPATAPLHIKCIHKDTGNVLYKQTIEKITVGTEQVVNAPNLEGYKLADETPKKIKIINSTTGNEVIFEYDGGPKVNLLNDVDHYRYLIGYREDGTIRPEREISREEVATVFYRLLNADARAEYRTKIHNFPDVNIDRWSLGEISTMANLGIVQGYEDGFFYPVQPITRAEFATVTMRFDILIEDATHGFTDISGHWAERYIASAYQVGWIDGYEDGSFQPDKPITRTEAAKLINRVLKRRVDQVGLLGEIVIKWPDLEVEHWGYYELMEATISHDYERRYEERVMENWTGKGTDMYFSTDDIPTPSPDQLPPYQPSPERFVWTEQNTEPVWVPEIVAEPAEYIEEAPEAAPISDTAETISIPKEDYEELLRILAIKEQEEAIKAAEEAEARAKAEEEAAIAIAREMVTISKEEYEAIMKAISEINTEALPKKPAEAVTHTVVLGDTLWAISEKYGTTIWEIKVLNGLTSDVIHLGQQLRVN